MASDHAPRHLGELWEEPLGVVLGAGAIPATFVRYHVALARIAERIPPLSPMDLAELDDFLAEHAHQYAARWIEDSREAWASLAGSATG